MNASAYAEEIHPSTGWRVLRLTCGHTVARFVPAVGSNLIGLQVEGTEYLADVAADDGRILGTPILYPSPNRVRGAQFGFGGRTFRFPPNNGTNFIHGLVREEPWEVGQPAVGAESVSIDTWFTFAPGSRAFELFPIRNTLELTYTLRPSVLRLDFRVHNQDETQSLPFGLAIHPYFRILGPRASVSLHVPACKWMEAQNLLPTGRLLALAEGPADLSQPTSLEHLNLDDVFWGLAPERPQVIAYGALGKTVTLAASELFTHSVIYTPQGQPFFCVENQSCSTDAHNLYAQGLQEAAHLQILAPGETASAWVELRVGS